MIFKDETSAQNHFRSRLSALGCLTEKLHGGIYQNGLPDLLVGIPLTKVLHLVEMKVVKSIRNRTTVSTIIDLLRTGKQGSRQLAVCAQWGGNGFPVWIVTALAHAEDPVWSAVRLQRPTREWLESPVEWGPVETALAPFLRVV